MTAVQPGSDAVGLDPPANSAITQQPGGFGSSFGPPGVTVRYLTNSTEDSEFAGRLIIVAFEPKVKHAAGERK